MTQVLIVYCSTYGNTKKMAESVKEGVSSVKGVTAVLKETDQVTKEDLLSAHAVICGSPVHMGCMDWRMKKFIDDVCSPLWMKDLLIGKIGAVFCTGSGYGGGGGGCEINLLGMMANLAELGMILVPLPKNTPGYLKGGIHWGPYGRSAGPAMEQIGVDADSLTCAFHHGAHVARLAAKIGNEKYFA